MPQQKAWEKEYDRKTFVTGNNVPQADCVRFAKWLKKDAEIEVDGLTVIDLGCGIGKNAIYFAERGAKVIAIDIAQNALKIAGVETKAAGLENNITFYHQSISEKFPVESNSIDIALDVTSSNSLSSTELDKYLSELNRTLKSGAYLFIRGLAKEGDPHAKFLLENHAAGEPDTYKMPDTGIVERVWTKPDFEKTYGEIFAIDFYEKIQHYTTVNGRKYKRNYFVAYLRKK